MAEKVILPLPHCLREREMGINNFHRALVVLELLRKRFNTHTEFSRLGKNAVTNWILQPSVCREKGQQNSKVSLLDPAIISHKDLLGG